MIYPINAYSEYVWRERRQRELYWYIYIYREAEATNIHESNKFIERKQLHRRSNKHVKSVHKLFFSATTNPISQATGKIPSTPESNLTSLTIWSMHRCFSLEPHQLSFLFTPKQFKVKPNKSAQGNGLRILE